jgi:DNA-binding NtrC family response regulator
MRKLIECGFRPPDTLRTGPMRSQLPDPGTTVLVVDDEPDVLDGCTRLLERLGYVALAAATQTEALRLADEHTGEIHFVVTDVVGHYMNGLELAAKLGERYPHIRCLLMSGYPAEVLMQRGLISDGIPFIQKPFERATFDETVRATLAAPAA